MPPRRSQWQGQRQRGSRTKPQLRSSNSSSNSSRALSRALTNMQVSEGVSAALTASECCTYRVGSEFAHMRTPHEEIIIYVYLYNIYDSAFGLLAATAATHTHTQWCCVSLTGAVSCRCRGILQRCHAECAFGAVTSTSYALLPLSFRARSNLTR